MSKFHQVPTASVAGASSRWHRPVRSCRSWVSLPAPVGGTFQSGHVATVPKDLVRENSCWLPGAIGAGVVSTNSDHQQLRLQLFPLPSLALWLSPWPFRSPSLQILPPLSKCAPARHDATTLEGLLDLIQRRVSVHYGPCATPHRSSGPSRSVETTSFWTESQRLTVEDVERCSMIFLELVLSFFNVFV